MSTLNWRKGCGRKLNVENIGEWSAFLKYLGAMVIILILVGLGYWLVIAPNAQAYEKGVSQEKILRNQFEEQQQEVAHLHAYRQKRVILQHRFGEMQKQLSKQHEMPGLLADISKIGVQSGLTFELFAPQPEVAHDFYRKLPIQLVVVGNYHQFAKFVSRIALMKRIVTLHDFEIRPYPAEAERADLSLAQQSLKNQTELLRMTMVVKVYWVRQGVGTEERIFAKESIGLSLQCLSIFGGG